MIATGATPIVIPIEGDSSATLSVNDLADYRRFRQQLADKNMSPFLVMVSSAVNLLMI